MKVSHSLHIEDILAKVTAERDLFNDKKYG